jgi:hypothetical protein
VATVVKKCFGHEQKKLYRSIYNFFEMAQNLRIFFLCRNNRDKCQFSIRCLRKGAIKKKKLPRNM